MASSYYDPIGPGRFDSRVQQGVTRVWNAVDDIANQRQHDSQYAPVNGALRRVNAAAAQGADLTQQFDPFGNNHYSDASNPWAAFFGAPAQPWKTATYDKYDRDSYMLPEAYAGQNEYLGKTITKMIYDDETYYTQILMPIRFTNQQAVSWDVWTFNQTFTGMVPELGVSRLVSSHRETMSDTIVRRGLAARFEHGFMDTPEGRAHYFLTLAQISNAVRETLNFGVIYAYLTCHDYNKEWQAKHGYFKRETLQDMLRRENFMWAIAIKAEFGLEKLDAQIIEWMNLHRTSADTWVLPPKVASYLRLVPAEKVYYYTAGQEGPNRVNDIVSGGRPHESNKPSARTQDVVEPYAVFKKNNVFLTRSYHVENTGPIDLMNRVSSVGEYFKLTRTGDDDCNVGPSYMTCWNNTRIYNEDEDTGYTVTLMEGLRHCMVFNDDGTPRQLEGMEDPIDARDLEQVFWLRSETDANGRLLFKNIEIMGDIDPTFMPVESVAKLARTMIHSAGVLSGDDAEALRAQDRNLSNGAALVQRLANMPVTANSGVFGEGIPWEESIAGMTTFAGITAIAGAGNAAESVIAAAFLAALASVVATVGPLLGGSGNMFLNPANVQGAGEGGAGQVLYENLFAAGLVPLVSASDRQVPVSTTRLAAAITQIEAALRASFVAGGGVVPGVLAALGDAEVATYRRLYNAATVEPRTVTDVNKLLVFIEQHPVVADVQGKNSPIISAWAREMRQALSVTGTQTGFTGTTNLAISRGNRQLTSGKLPAGLRPAGPLEGLGAAPGFPEGGFGVQSSILDQMPIMQSVLAAHGQGRVGGRAGGNGRRGFDSLFADDDGDDDGFGSAPVGALFPGGAEGQEQIADLRARRSRLPQTGLTLGKGDPRLRFGVLSHNLEELAAFGGSGLERVVATLYFTAPWRRQTLESWLSRNIMPNFGIIGFRVGLYDMALGIKCKAGSETAFTAFGNSRFMLADDATTMAHYGNFTFYGKSIVHRPENVFVAYDIFPNRCLGGMGVSPYTSPAQYNAQQGVAMRDIFYCMVPYRENTFNTIMDMAGRFYTYMDSGMLDDEDPVNRALHYSTAGFYNRIWNWYSEDDVTTQVDQPMYAMSNPGQNRIVWQGAQGKYNAMAHGGYNYNRDIIRNKSPWGPNVYDGCKACRDGQMERQRVVTDGILGF